jgi:hypothetical protein
MAEKIKEKDMKAAYEDFEGFAGFMTQNLKGKGTRNTKKDKTGRTLPNFKDITNPCDFAMMHTLAWLSPKNKYERVAKGCKNFAAKGKRWTQAKKVWDSTQ